MRDYVQLAERTFNAPFKQLKIEIVRQSLPALQACGCDDKCIANKAYFQEQLIDNTNYELKTFLPEFILKAIILAIVEWLIRQWLDDYFQK
jgi:hypothetical protein